MITLYFAVKYFNYCSYYLSYVCMLQGPGMMMTMIQFVQKECDRQAREIFQRFRENRDFDHKVISHTQVHTQTQTHMQVLALQLTWQPSWHIEYHTTLLVIIPGMLRPRDQRGIETTFW